MNTENSVLRIFEAILEVQNGYSKEEAQKLAIDCKHCELWNRIDDILKKNNPPKPTI